MTSRRNRIISAWLSDVSDASAGAVLADSSSQQPPTTKQQDDSTATKANELSPGKRRALEAVDGNTIMPSKKTKYAMGAEDKEEMMDAEATPRATRAGVLSPSQTRRSQRQHTMDPGFDSSNDDPPTQSSYGQKLFAEPLPVLHKSKRSESSTATSSTGVSAKSSKKSRSRSPVKTTANLAMAEKPIRFRMLDDAAVVPADVLELFRELNGVQAGHGVLPMEIENEVRTACKGIPELYSYNFSQRPPSYSSLAESRSKINARLESEMEALLDIIPSTHKYISTPPSETTWNESVHSQVLRLALKHHSYTSTTTTTGSSKHSIRITYHNVTFARPMLQLVPRNISGELFEAKMVDYVMTISEPTILQRVEACLKHQDPPFNDTINHTDYAPLLYEPIAVSVETKAPGGAVAHPQLAVWAAAHFARLRVLLNLPQTEDYDESMITLPLLAVEGSRWDVLFAVDKGTSVELVRVPGVVGDTATLLGCYKALALLKCLVRWIQEVFAPWFAEKVLATAEI